MKNFRYNLLTFEIKYSIIVIESNCKIAMFGIKVPVNCYVRWLARNS